MTDRVEAIRRNASDYWIGDGGPPAWRVADLHGPTGAERSDDAAAEALRAELPSEDHDGPLQLPRAGWRVLARTRREVVFGAEEDGEHYLVTVERERNGAWAYATSTYGVGAFRALRNGNPASDWQLDQAAENAGTELSVLVTEIHCASGRGAEGRIEPPDVFYCDDEIRIVAYVTPLPGPQKCPGNPRTPAVFVLPEPIGDRRLVDAGRYEL